MKKIDFAISILLRTREFGLDYGANRPPSTSIAALMLLAKAGDWMKGTDLGRALRIDPSAFSCTIHAVLELGLVERRQSRIGKPNGWDWKLMPAGERAVAKLLASDPEPQPVEAVAP